MKGRMILSLLSISLLNSCASTNDDVNGVDPCGVYSLMSIDGSLVPTMTRHGNQDVFVQSGTFTINRDGTCISEVVFGPSSDKLQSRVVHATYTQKGTQLKMKWKGAGQTKGTIEGDVFTMNNEGMIFKYQREF